MFTGHASVTGCIRPPRKVLAYPYRMGSPLSGDADRLVPGRQQAGCLVAVIDSETLTGVIDVGVDGVLGDSELAADLL